MKHFYNISLSPFSPCFKSLFQTFSKLELDISTLDIRIIFFKQHTSSKLHLFGFYWRLIMNYIFFWLYTYASKIIKLSSQVDFFKWKHNFISCLMFLLSFCFFLDYYIRIPKHTQYPFLLKVNYMLLTLYNKNP